ncbi:MAG: hypothetical protein WCJ95_11535 [Mariniphaga sp.]
MKRIALKIIVTVTFSMLVFMSCEDDDKVQEISKNGSVETVMSVDHLNDSLDIVKTSHKIWIKNVLVKNIIHADTIPTLGVTTEEGENSDGDTKKVSLKKDYEIFITVK